MGDVFADRRAVGVPVGDADSEVDDDRLDLRVRLRREVRRRRQQSRRRAAADEVGDLRVLQQVVQFHHQFDGTCALERVHHDARIARLRKPLHDVRDELVRQVRQGDEHTVNRVAPTDQFADGVVRGRANMRRLSNRRVSFRRLEEGVGVQPVFVKREALTVRDPNERHFRLRREHSRRRLAESARAQHRHPHRLSVEPFHHVNIPQIVKNLSWNCIVQC